MLTAPAQPGTNFGPAVLSVFNGRSETTLCRSGWLPSPPPPAKKKTESSTECGTNLAEGTAIRLLVRTNARSPNHAVYIYGGTFAEFRSLLVNP